MITLALIFSGIIYLSMFFYFPFVFLNLTFTFASLDASHIPFYAGGDLARYSFEWWFLATDVLRLIPAMIMLLILGVPFSKFWSEFRATTFQVIFRVTLFILGIWELAKLVYYAIIWIWDSMSVLDNCYEVLTCGTANNTIFYVIFAYAAFYFIWFMAWSIFLGDSIGDYLQSGGKSDIPAKKVMYEPGQINHRINSKMDKRH